MGQINGKHNTHCGVRWAKGKIFGGWRDTGGFLEEAALSQILSDDMTQFIPTD